MSRRFRTSYSPLGADRHTEQTHRQTHRHDRHTEQTHRQTHRADRHDRKHYLPAYAGGNKKTFQQDRINKFYTILICRHPGLEFDCNYTSFARPRCESPHRLRVHLVTLYTISAGFGVPSARSPHLASHQMSAPARRGLHSEVLKFTSLNRYPVLATRSH